MNSNYFLTNGSFSTYLMTYTSYCLYSDSLTLACNKINNLLPVRMQDIINNKIAIKASAIVATLTIPALHPSILLINFLAFIALDIFTIRYIHLKDQTTQTVEETSNTQTDIVAETQNNIIKPSTSQLSKKSIDIAKDQTEDPSVTFPQLFEIRENLRKNRKITITDVPFLTAYTAKDESVLKNNVDILEEIHIILNQKELNHAVLCGEAGSGKTCLVKVLAQELAEGKLPYLKEYELYKLDAANLGSNTSYSGQLNTKISNLKKFIDSKRVEGIKIILFIDEIHQLSGMGTTSSDSNDVWQFLKEGMSDSSFTVLGTTTEDEYNLNIAKDKALKSRLTKVKFPPLSEEIIKKILEFKAEELKGRYESLKFITEDEISQIIKRAKKDDPSVNLRDIMRNLNFEFSKEDIMQRQCLLQSAS